MGDKAATSTAALFGFVILVQPLQYGKAIPLQNLSKALKEII